MATSTNLLRLVFTTGASAYWLSMLTDASLKGLILLALACVLTLALALRKFSAAERHLVWAATLACLLVLPVLSAAMPSWQVLPNWLAASPEVTTAAVTKMPSHAAPATTPIDFPQHHSLSASPKDFVGQTKVGAAADPLSASANSREAKEARAAAIAFWTLVVWSFGVAVCLAPIALGHFCLWRLKRNSRPLTDDPWRALVKKASHRLGLRRRVMLLENDQGNVPMVWGIFRPKLLLPRERSEWSEERRYVVLLHELAHVKRWDCATKTISHLARAIYWFNPLVWLAAKRIQVECEQACDDLVLGVGNRPSDYAEHLVEITSGLQASRLAVHNSMAMARPAELEGRVRAILSGTRNRRKLSVIAILFAVALAAGISVPLAAMQAESGDATNSYASSDINIHEVTELANGEIAIRFTTMAESMWWCPGANSEITNEGIELTFVRSHFKSRPKVSHPRKATGDGSDIIKLAVREGQAVFLKDKKGAVQLFPIREKKEKQGTRNRFLTNRQQFAKTLAQIKSDDTEAKVRKILGSPEHVRRDPEPVPYPTDEIWCYGMDGPGSLATLGEVCFRDGKVIWIAGGGGKPPTPEVVSERELRAALQFLHPGPEHAGYNDPLHLIRVTNYLQPMGKEKALAIIGEYPRIHHVDETWLFLLLRTLFDVPDPPGHMPKMMIGAMSPAPPEDLTSIPRFPVVIVDDIPFSLLWGVTLGGRPQPVIDHVKYFRKHGTLRTGRLQPPDDPYPSLKKLLASAEWKAMAGANASPRMLANYTGHTLLQVLAMGRTAYDPPKARQPFAYPKMADFDRHHAAFLDTGARWDEAKQIYVRQDGRHGPTGHMANIYADRPNTDATLYDTKKAKNAPVVLRVQQIESPGAFSKRMWIKVKVLEELKNETAHDFDGEITVGCYSFGHGLPSGVSTIYLARNTSPNLIARRMWPLLEGAPEESEDPGKPGAGFSHNVPESQGKTAREETDSETSSKSPAKMIAAKPVESDVPVTVKVRVTSYDGEASFTTGATPTGETFQIDNYDAAHCKVVSGGTDLPDPFVIWGWNRTMTVPESLRKSGETATISFLQSAIDDLPFDERYRGIAAAAILKIGNPDAEKTEQVAELAEDRPDTDSLLDADLAKTSPVVLRVRLIELGEGSKYLWPKVRVLKVLKNDSDQKFSGDFRVAHLSFGAGLPEGESTIYLHPYNTANPETKHLWRLNEVAHPGKTVPGFSHHVPSEKVTDLSNRTPVKMNEVSKDEIDVDAARRFRVVLRVKTVPHLGKLEVLDVLKNDTDLKFKEFISYSWGSVPGIPLDPFIAYLMPYEQTVFDRPYEADRDYVAPDPSTIPVSIHLDKVTATESSTMIVEGDSKKKASLLNVSCDVRLANKTVETLAVRTNFYSVLDGFVLVVTDEAGKELYRQGYTHHQSPSSYEGRELDLPVGELKTRIIFPISEPAWKDKMVKVHLFGGLPGTEYYFGLRSNSLPLGKVTAAKSHVVKFKTSDFFMSVDWHGVEWQPQPKLAFATAGREAELLKWQRGDTSWREISIIAARDVKSLQQLFSGDTFSLEEGRFEPATQDPRSYTHFILNINTGGRDYHAAVGFPEESAVLWKALNEAVPLANRKPGKVKTVDEDDGVGDQVREGGQKGARDPLPAGHPSYAEFVSSHTFPYVAPAERRTHLKKKYASLTVGLTKADVEKLLGKPDFSREIQSKGGSIGDIGSSWTYCFRIADPNLTNEKTDKTIQVFFDVSGKTDWIVSNVDGLSNIERPERNRRLENGQEGARNSLSPERADKPAPKGMELYSWGPPNRGTHFSLLSATGRQEPASVITGPETEIVGVNKLKTELSRLTKGEQVDWNNMAKEPVPHKVIQAVQQICDDLDITLHRPSGTSKAAGRAT